jgi:hypothetical protein
LHRRRLRAVEHDGIAAATSAARRQLFEIPIPDWLTYPPFSLLAYLEDVLRYTKFEFRRMSEKVYVKEFGDWDWAGAQIGVILENGMQAKLSIFGGFFHVKIFNQALANVYILGKKYSIVDIKFSFSPQFGYKSPIPESVLKGIATTLGTPAAALKKPMARLIGLVNKAERKLLQVRTKVLDFVACWPRRRQSTQPLSGVRRDQRQHAVVSESRWQHL